MKKVSLLAILATIGSGSIASAEVATPNCPKAFQGFHLGGNIGYGVGEGNQKFVQNEGNISGVKNKLGFNGVDGGIGVGYTHRFGNWGLGLAFDANWSNTKGRVRTFDNEGGELETASVQARLRNSLQLYARAGYVIGGMAMPFVGLGWDNSAWKQSFTTTETGSPNVNGSKTKRHNALLWKAGVDFLATKHVVVGFEYTGTYAGRKKFSKTDNASGDQFAASFKPQYNKFALTAKIVY